MATALRGAVVPVAIVARGVGNEAVIAWPARHVTCHVTRIVAGSNQDTSRVQPVTRVTDMANLSLLLPVNEDITTENIIHREVLL